MSTQMNTPQTVTTGLSRIRRAIRSWVAVDTASKLMLSLAGYFFLTLVLDRWFRFDLVQRSILLMAGLGWLGYVVYRWMVKPWLQQVSDQSLLMRVEQQHPELAESMISAVSFSQMKDVMRLGVSPAMVAATIRLGFGRAGQVNFIDVVDVERRNRNLLILALTLLVWLGSAGTIYAFSPDTLNIWFNRNVLLGERRWPTDTHLRLIDHRATMARGDNWTLRVRADGVIPADVFVDVRPAGGGRLTERLRLRGERIFVATFKNVQEEFEFRVRGGDDRTDWLAVTMRDRPVVEQLQLMVHTPAYMNEPPRALPTQDSSHSLYPGSRITIEAGSTKPLASAVLMRGEEKLIDLAVGAQPVQVVREGETEAISLWMVNGEISAAQLQPGTYRVDLMSKEGLGNRPPTQFSIRIKPDLKPKLRCRLDGIGAIVAANAYIPIDSLITDDFAVTGADLVYRRDAEGVIEPGGDGAGGDVGEGGGPVEVPMESDIDRSLESLSVDPADLEAADDPADGPDMEPVESPLPEETRLPVTGLKDQLGEREIRHTEVFDLAKLAPELRVGETVQFFLEATDNDAITGPKRGRSTVFFVRVVSRDELLAELLRREQAQGREFDNVNKDQDDMLTDTEVLLADLRTEGTLLERQAKQLESLEKRQRMVARRLDIISRQFESILKEFEHNRLEKDGSMRERLNERIIQPMREIATQGVPYASDQLDLASRHDSTAEQREAALAEASRVQQMILEDMKRIRAQMKKWELYQEMVSIARELLEDQMRLREDVEKELERIQREAAEEIFGPGGR